MKTHLRLALLLRLRGARGEELGVRRVRLELLHRDEKVTQVHFKRADVVHLPHVAQRGDEALDLRRAQRIEVRHKPRRDEALDVHRVRALRWHRTDDGGERRGERAPHGAAELVRLDELNQVAEKRRLEIKARLVHPVCEHGEKVLDDAHVKGGVEPRLQRGHFAHLSKEDRERIESLLRACVRACVVRAWCAGEGEEEEGGGW